MKHSLRKNSPMIKLKDIEAEVRDYILQQQPFLTPESSIRFTELLNYRLDYIKQLISKDSASMNQVNQEIIEKIRQDQTITHNVNDALKKKATIGEKAADSIAKFGGSWPFILLFIFILIVWITLNSINWFIKPFDSYPFILLNLALSCLAAIQAPIIMMSQNRQAARDRAEADNDYRVNLKAELEISLLHDKLDFLMANQLQQLLEFQQLQVELISQLQEQIEEMRQRGKK